MYISKNNYMHMLQRANATDHLFWDRWFMSKMIKNYTKQLEMLQATTPTTPLAIKDNDYAKLMCLASDYVEGWL
jgi:hypothetical protein